MSPELIQYLQSFGFGSIILLSLIGIGYVIFRMSTKRCTPELGRPVPAKDCVGRDYVNQQSNMYDLDKPDYLDMFQRLRELVASLKARDPCCGIYDFDAGAESAYQQSAEELEALLDELEGKDED